MTTVSSTHRSACAFNILIAPSFRVESDMPLGASGQTTYTTKVLTNTPSKASAVHRLLDHYTNTITHIISPFYMYIYTHIFCTRTRLHIHICMHVMYVYVVYVYCILPDVRSISTSRPKAHSLGVLERCSTDACSTAECAVTVRLAAKAGLESFRRDLLAAFDHPVYSAKVLGVDLWPRDSM